jgi:cytoskeletal protein RodZ
MKEERNNEIDLLLRRLSRAEAASEPPIDGDHLDADELNSYVENALPAAARARYTGHLSECASCRKLVAQLSSPVGLVNEKVSAVSEASAFKKFIANLFSPMVLRYAVPALGLIVVAAIGFTVLRRDRQRNEPSVAQVTEQDRSMATPSNEQAPSPPSSSNSRVAAPAKSPPTAAPRPHESIAADAAPAPAPNAPPTVTVTTDVRQDAAKAEVQTAAANSPEPKPTATPIAVHKQTTVQPVASADSRSENTAAPASAGTGSARSGVFSVGELAKTRRAEAREKDSAETRSVAGRRFRKEKGVWIDTEYDSARATVNLTRGSEQYRALVADEPTIKTIADQLDGEIIVIWKGRAYHIR